MNAAAETGLDEIGVAELAEARRSSKRATRRWLASLERRHPGLVSRRAGRMITTTEQIRPFVERAPSPSRLEGEVRRLRSRVEELERRADRHACDLAEFRRTSNEWFRRHERASGRG